MKKSIIILLLAGAITQVKAQQLQTSSFYDMQGVLHNPSTVGAQASSFVGATYRTQWSGISGGPRTATVFGSFKMPAHNIGLGGYIYADKTGPTKRTGIQMAFAKHIPLKNDATF